MSKKLIIPDKSYTDKMGMSYMFHCPGCKMSHILNTEKTNSNNSCWKFNNDLEKPTFNPSLLVTCPKFGKSETDRRCHSFVRDGKIEFLNDCTHELKGQTVELEDIEDIEE